LTNWNDGQFQSGMAFDGLAVDGTPIPSVAQEKISMVLLGSGLAGVAAARRRRRKQDDDDKG
jgi:hypothetical protein